MIFNDTIKYVSVLCVAMSIYTGGVLGMKPIDSVGESSLQQGKEPPCYRFDWYKRRLSGIDKTKEGREVLQKNYPHKVENFELTQKAMKNILADIKSGVFKTDDMQAVLDYMHWWYTIDAEQVYEAKIIGKTYDGVRRIYVYEWDIRDLAAQILDELQHTGGTAYATLHWRETK